MIRSLSLDDLPQIDTIAAEAQQEGFQFAARWRDAVASMAKKPDSHRQFFLGVFDEETLVALGGVTTDPYIEEDCLGRVRHVYVAAAERRRGFGRRLLAALEQRAQGAYTSLRLRTDTQRAAAFYESLGYSRTDEVGATHRRTLP
jgi:GNAT superfamily N-acetyltransferase